jgi:hypothetical protein
MSGHILADRTSLFLENTVFAVDPATEYLYYDALMNRFLDDASAPDVFRDYVRELVKRKKGGTDQFSGAKTRFHNDFWQKIIEDANTRNRLLRHVFQDTARLGVDFLIPPVPLILNDTLFNVAARVNEISQEIALALGRKECANYFLLPSNALRDSSLLEKVKKYLLYNPAHINILKLKYLDITAPGMIEERENYRQLLLDLAYLSKTFRDKCFMVLENYYQCFPSAVVGCDIVSSSVTGYDGEHGRSKHPTYGKWIDPRLMVPVDFDNVRRIFHNNGDMLPCHHDVCREVSNIDYVTPSEWNNVRRQHCQLYYNDLMIQIARAIRERNLELAREKLLGSQLSNLRALVAGPTLG